MPRRRARRGDPINGMLLLDKPDGMSSNRALQKARALLDAQKAGHTGSLDPIATGLLPLCFGQATKISSLFLNSDKSYVATVCMGISTDSGDREGKVISTTNMKVTRSQVEQALTRFAGTFEQLPPMYSAIKYKGQPLYKLARQGVEVERAPREVTVYRMDLTDWSTNHVELSISCSKGFYVRALAMELGNLLGCGAHVSELRRTRVGDFSLDNSITLHQLAALESVTERQNLLVPTDRALSHLPKIALPDDTAYYFCQGQAVRGIKLPQNGLARLYTVRNKFLGLGEVTPDGTIAPKRLFV